jgi:hypothetical protein
MMKWWCYKSLKQSQSKSKVPQNLGTKVEIWLKMLQRGRCSKTSENNKQQQCYKTTLWSQKWRRRSKLKLWNEEFYFFLGIMAIAFNHF